MTDIDKAVELARSCLIPDGPIIYEVDVVALARAVLAMAPVVERARTYVAWPNSDDFAALRSTLTTLDAEARRG